MDASVARRFARAAHSYARGAALHEEVADALLARLAWPDAGATRRILDIGCGTGILTVRLRQAYPGAHITAVDAAESMTHAVARRMGPDGAFTALACDLRVFEPAERFDLLASSSALHWMTPLHATASHLAGLVPSGGHLRAALMVRGTLAELHDLRRRSLPDLPPAQQLPEAGEVAEAFAAAGWRLATVTEQSFVPRYASPVALLRTLHAQGLTGGSVSHGRRLLTRGELARLTEAYGREYGDAAGGVPATYRVLFMAAER